MVERDVTAQTEGVLQHQLKFWRPWRWERRHDSVGKNKHRRYYDGVLHCGIFAWPCEVKMGDDKLKDSEETRLRTLSEQYHVPCVVIRVYPIQEERPIKKSNVRWVFEEFGSDDYVDSGTGNIALCLNWLLGKSYFKMADITAAANQAVMMGGGRG